MTGGCVWNSRSGHQHKNRDKVFNPRSPFRPLISGLIKAIEGGSNQFSQSGQIPRRGTTLYRVAEFVRFWGGQCHKTLNKEMAHPLGGCLKKTVKCSVKPALWAQANGCGCRRSERRAVLQGAEAINGVRRRCRAGRFQVGLKLVSTGLKSL